MTTDATAQRRRAPAMSTEDRRAEIVRATLPLLAEHGINVTTAQIAQAAGIAEGTVFRVFKDKQELLDVCVWSVLETSEVCKQIDEIQRNLPLADQLIAALKPLAEQWKRAGVLMHTLAASGYQSERHEASKAEDLENHPMVIEFNRVVTALSNLLVDSKVPLRQSEEQIAKYLLFAAFAERMNKRGEDNSEHTIENLVDLFLNGIVDRSAGGSIK